MPLDATNMPFRRSAAFENNDSSFPESADTKWDTSLKAESILLEEFNYISITAYQLKEGRASLFNIYLIIIGITTTALGTIATLYSSLQPVIGSQTIPDGGSTLTEPVHGQNYDVLALAITLLAVISLLSSIFFLRFIHISKKYKDCLIAIEKIKEFYKVQFALEMPSLKTAFHWNSDTIPTLGGIGSFMFLAGSLTVAIGVLSIGIGIILALNVFFNIHQPKFFIDGIYVQATTTIIVTVVSIIWLFGHGIYYYKSLIRASKKKGKLKKQAAIKPH